MQMYKIFFISISLFILIHIQPQEIKAGELPELSVECIKKMEERDEQFTRLIMQDIISSFQLDIDEHAYIEVSFRELEAAKMIYNGKEKDDYYDSLKKQFIVRSRGEPRLFIRPQEAYFLYKEPNNTDVMIHLQLIGTTWEEVDQKKKKGNNIEYKLLTCEKEYIEKKKKYYQN